MPKPWLLQRGFQQSDRLPSEEEGWEWKLFWISASQDPVHGSISKAPLFPSMGQCHFSKMQLGRKVKQNHAAFCLLLSTSEALPSCSSVEKIKMFNQVLGAQEFRTHNLTMTFAELWKAELCPPRYWQPYSWTLRICYFPG